MILPIVGSVVYFLHDQSEKSDKIRTNKASLCVVRGNYYRLFSSFTQQHQDSRNASEILNHQTCLPRIIKRIQQGLYQRSMLTESPCTSEKNFNVKETGSQSFALSVSPLKEGKHHFRHFGVLALKRLSIFLPSPRPTASASNLINSAKFDGAAGSAIKKNINIIWDVIYRCNQIKLKYVPNNSYDKPLFSWFERVLIQLSVRAFGGERIRND